MEEIDLREKKQCLRKEIFAMKKSLSLQERMAFSQQIFSCLEKLPDFINARCVALYYSLPDEVQTETFIRKWYATKKILLPVVEPDNNLKLVAYKGIDMLHVGAFGISEPINNEGDEDSKPDIIIVPGIAFDRNLNRMGRGKGFYDRLLVDMSVPKYGICYGFQLFDSVPAGETDVRMNHIITEKEFI